MSRPKILQAADFTTELKKWTDPAATRSEPVADHPAPALALPPDLVERLPDVFQRYMEYASPLTDAPDEFLLMPFIAMAGTHIGQRRWASLGGVTLYPVIWTVVFAGSSVMRKSTAVSLAKKPFRSVIDRWRNEYKQELATWQAAQQAASANKERFTDPEPKQRTLYCADGFSDLTFWEELQYNGNIISVPSEFTALWQELTRSRNGLEDLALGIFDSENSIRRNTRSGGNIELNNPVWGIAGATTLSAFQRSLSSTERGSGLLQRIIPVTMLEPTKPFRPLTMLPKPDGRLYADLCQRMLDVLAIGKQEMRFTSEAEERFTAWSYDLHQRTLQLSGKIQDIAGYTSRLESYGVKYALIFQAYTDPGADITAANMDAAIALAEWNLQHIIYMLEQNYIFDQYHADRLKLRQTLEKKGGTLARSELMNLTHLNKEQLDRALANEMDAGYITEKEVDTGGARKKKTYQLNNPA